MTELIFDSTPDTDNDLWTTGRLADELFLKLASITEKIYNNKGRPVTVHKYYRQAREKMYKIPIFRPSPPLVIYISDLTPRLRKELEDIYNEDLTNNKKQFDYILRKAAGRFFENLDFEYFHMSIMKFLTVRLE